ncbi:MAG: hypothetical protein R3189_01355 [Thiomicrorhabdus chilensis]|uniref:hypothetical protein n=1 Tax=Thiomicrorhabdus chilensis TaxID=63656 RepID=UPI0012FDB028|nr:hypothetical protein [Thiomicrorhabdus chilensis]MDX1346874.1 hypothetical protein [Thiomicrorhabdus chilensis]
MSDHLGKRLIESMMQINPVIRKRIARILILIGIVMAYSPYWADDFVEKEMAVNFSNTLVSTGWWVLAVGLVFYFFNLWSDVKSEKES